MEIKVAASISQIIVILTGLSVRSHLFLLVIADTPGQDNFFLSPSHFQDYLLAPQLLFNQLNPDIYRRRY